MSELPAGAILAGGMARRFSGVAKGLERVGGVRMVDRVLAALGEVTSEIVLVGASPSVAQALPALCAIPDEAPGSGPLGGILSALRAARRETLVVAWDMPFITASELRPLVAGGVDADAVAWEVDGRVEPLCALYRASAARQLAEAFTSGERSPREALRHLRVHLVRRDATDRRSAFASINTAEQLAVARHRHETGTSS